MTDLKAALERSIQAMAKESPASVDELLKDEKFFMSLGEHAAPLQMLLQEYTSPEE